MEAQCINIIETLAPCLTRGGMDPGLAQFLSIAAGVLLISLLPLVLVIIFIWLERKVAARVQDRIGPNRVGPFGLLQNVADAVKLIIKEDITPAGADRVIYNAAPIVAIFSVIAIWAVVPLTPIHIGADLDIGVVFFVAIGSVGTLAIMMAGWSSNNKYALLGAFRVVAALVSYEVPMIVSLLVPLMLAGTMSMQGIVEAQQGMWFIVTAPIAALIFYISNLAETGRAPFDLIEAESELVAGYNIEYSGMKFGLFMASEFLHSFTANLLFAVLFLGGWSGPFVYQIPALGFVWLMAKTAVPYIFTLILRATIPRVRIDQMMAFNWKFLVPVSIVNVLLVALVLKIIQTVGLAPAPGFEHDFIANLPQAVILLLTNLLMAGVILNMLRSAGRRERLADQASRAIVPATAATSVTTVG
ncbi:MAG: NADH-quinone oxidoreductase subunit NuoH [bacterium]|nr:NADH-quinone oxidoreductase subunit NuoH [bacterium]